MSAILYWVRSDLRHRRWAAVGLAVLVAVAVVVPLTAAAAAQRTASSLDRMRAELEPYHADVQFEESDPPADALERIAAIPGVEIVDEGATLLARPEGSGLDFFEAFGQGAVGESLMREFERPRIDAGRLPAAADEVLLSTRIATERGLEVGDEVGIETLTPGGLGAVFAGELAEYDGPTVPLTIVGIGRQPEEVTGGGDDTSVSPSFVVAPAFFEAWDGEVAAFTGIFLVRLVDGIDGADDFQQAVRAEFAGRSDIGVNVSAERERIDDAVAAQALGLVLLAVASGVAAAVAIGQAVIRFVTGEQGDRATLAALGFGSRARGACRTVAAALPAALGLAVGIGVAVSASAWFPTGAAGRVEPDPGVHVDWVVVAAGAAVTVALVAAAALVGDRRSSPHQRPSRVADRMARAGMPVAAVAGVRAALQGGARGRPVPVRSAMAAGVLGVAGVLAAVVFGASLGRLTDTPARFGFNWDLAVGIGDELSDDDAWEATQPVESDERVEAATLVRVDNIIVDGREEFVYAFRPVVGDLDFTVVAGRAVEREGEVALGGATLDALGVSIGDTVTAEGIDGEPVPLTVVGKALFPTVENEDAARGAALTLTTYDRLLSPGGGFPELYVRLAEGVDPAPVAADLEEIGFVNGTVAPPAVSNLRGVDEIPYALATFLGVLAMLAAGHAITTALRRRRDELAVLKTLGFVRQQLATTVVVQALVFGVLGLVLGLPLGYSIGRQSWQAVAGGLGFATDVLVPGWAALIAPAVLGALLLIAALPARAAARTPAADLLRSE